MRHSLPDRIDPQHCLLTQRYAVYTPPMDEMITQIGDWIDQQVSGGYLYGASRLGKSRCIQWHLKDALESRFDDSLPLVVWPRSPDNTRTEAEFWRELLKASGFKFVSSTRPSKKISVRNLFNERCIALAEGAQSNYVILLIDEAHDMRYSEWKWLLGLQNSLDYAGYMLSIFSVGSHQLNHQYQYLASSGNPHIAARFMAAHAQFHGLRSWEEVEYVLTAYDTHSQWPIGSGISFLEYFSPNDFHAGRRLAACAQSLWAALVALSPPKLSHHYQEFPMQHVARTTEAILFHLARGSDWAEATSYKNWVKELSKTHFSDHMRIISMEI